MPNSHHARTIKELPKGWTTREVRQLGSVVGGSTPSRDVPRFWNGDVPWVTPGEMTGLAGAKYLEDTAEKITRAGYQSCGTRLLPSRSLLVTSRATLGVVALCRREVSTNQGFKSVLFADGGQSPDFHFHYFQRLKPEMERLASGTTFLEISARDFGTITVASPPLPEQRAIAAVLDTLDDAIQKTEQIIAKLKQVKQGLLHDLLTRGIDDNGELRDPERHPEQFQDSPLGRIPKGWEVRRFGDLCESSAFGPRFPGDRYAEDGAIATLRTTDIDDDGVINLSTMPRANIEAGAFAPHFLRLNDLVISRSGTCGIAAVFEGHEIDVVPGAFLIRFRLRRAAAAFFFRRYFNSRFGRPHLDRLAVGGVQKNIKGSDVLALSVLSPPESEKDEIALRIAAVDDRIAAEQAEVSGLSALKAGLTEDLLTGRVRTTSVGEVAA